MVGKEKSDKGKEKADVSIVAGVKDDCEELLRAFAAKLSVRFQDFVTVWQEMGFANIYCGRPTFRELYEFIDELLQIAKAYMLPPYPYRTRVGGIYLMYGLYFKQPLNDKLVPIKLDVKEWKEMVSFLQILVQDEHFDTFYTFRKLFEEHAFSFEASSIQYGFDRVSRMKLKKGSQPQKFDPMRYGLELLDEIDFVDEWSKHETLYHRLKAQSEEFSTANSFIPKNWPVEVLHATASSSTSNAVSRKSKKMFNDSSDDELDLSIGYRRALLKNRTVQTKKAVASTSNNTKSKAVQKKVAQKKKRSILKDAESSSDNELQAEEIFLPELDASREC